MNCWWCGIEPIEVHDVCVVESASPVRQIAHWPAGNHPRSEHPPTADELAAEGYRLLNQRVR